jgi:hypothetical protein
MIEYDSPNNPGKIIIPISGLQEILRYQLSILGILGNIDLLTCGPDMRAHVKAAFELLNHMQCTEGLQKLMETDEVRRFQEAFAEEISALKISLPSRGQQPSKGLKPFEG